MSASPPPVYDPSWRPEYKETQKAKDLCLRLDSVSTNSSPALSSPVEEPRSSADNHPLGRALTTNRSLPSDLNITVHENIRPTTTGPEPTDPPQAARIIFDGTHQVEILEGYKQDYILTRKGKQSFFRLKHEMVYANECCTCRRGCAALWSLLGYGGFIACVCVLVWQLHFATERQRLAIILSSVFLVFALLIIWIEASCSKTREYVGNQMSSRDAVLHIQDIRKVSPVIRWEVQCYHYENRPISSNRSSETRREKVVTYQSSTNFRYRRMQDVSGDISGFQKGSVTRVEFKNVIGFIDEVAKMSYEVQKTRAKEENRHRDREMQFLEKVTIKGTDEPIAVFMRKEDVSRCMTTRWFYLWAWFLCSWPYRCWFYGKTTTSNFTFFKLLGD